MTVKSLDLNVDCPDKVAAVLRAAAEAFYGGASECSSAWGDPKAGAPWAKLARILERAADQADKVKMPF